VPALTLAWRRLYVFLLEQFVDIIVIRSDRLIRCFCGGLTTPVVAPPATAELSWCSCPRCPVQMAVPQAAAGGSFARAVDAVLSDSYVPPVTPLQ